MSSKGILKGMEPNGEGIYYFLGNITSHILHALPLHKELGGTFVVLSEKAKREVEVYGVPVIALDNKPFRMQRYGYRIKPEFHYLKIDRDLKKTTNFLNENAKVVLFYELYDFDESVRLSRPKTLFLTHGNMLKDYMANGDRLEVLKQYDYMAALGPYLKQKLLANGVEPAKLVDIGIARTDEIVKNRGKVVVSPALANIPGLDPQKKVIAYLPTFWGASSVYDTGLEIVRNMPAEYSLLFRPHPQTPQKILKKYLDIMRTKDNVFYVPEGRYPGVGLVEIFDASSAIIGDVSSVMLEAVLTEKPLVFAYGHNEHKQSEEHYIAIKEIISCSGHIDSDNISALDDILTTSFKRGTSSKIWKQSMEYIFYNPSGTSVKAIADFVQTLG